MRARPIPRISIQAFCENGATAEIIQIASEDRRLAKAHVSVHMGGVEAAVAHYQQNPTPNLIIIESSLPRDHILAELDRLAENCDPGTKVLVIGHANDVLLYRELLKRGVSEYLVEPVDPMQLMEAISNLYNNPETEPVGHVYAFIGAKGGVGSSTVCHNAAWCAVGDPQGRRRHRRPRSRLRHHRPRFQPGSDAGHRRRPVEPRSSRRGAARPPADQVLRAPVDLRGAGRARPRLRPLGRAGCDQVIDVARQNVPYVAVDLPHTWTAWVKSILLQADEVIITAAPDLANLRNAKNIVDLLQQSRRNDSKPRLVMNMVNMPKRPEISVKEFESALGLKAISIIDFDSETFGQAANNGQMIEELSAKARSAAPSARSPCRSATGAIRRRRRRPPRSDRSSRN